MAAYGSTGGYRRMVPAEWAGWLNLILGLWMIISPFLLGYSTDMAALWDGVVLGVLVAIAGITATQTVSAAASWWNVAFGVWLFVSPWVLRFGEVRYAAANDMIVGAAVCILGLIGAATKSASPAGPMALNRGA